MASLWRAMLPMVTLSFVLSTCIVEAAPMNFTVYSSPVRLRYGEVHNKVLDGMALPPDVVARYASGLNFMAISGFDVDMVRVDARGRESRVKLGDHYLHHYTLYMGGAQTMDQLLKATSKDEMVARMLTGCHAMTRAGIHAFEGRLQREDPSQKYKVIVFGSASGPEYRDNQQRWYAPYRRVIWRPEFWTALLHIINTNKPGANASSESWSPLTDCPCSPQRVINVSAGTIDGESPSPPIHCSPQFAATGNPSCRLSTYRGGWRCCEHGMFLIDTDKECTDPRCTEEPLDEVQMKYTFYYEDALPSTRVIEAAACCDVTSVTQGDENIEYDVPECPNGTPPERCLHVAETVQPLAYYGGHPKDPEDIHKGSDLVDLVFAAPHLHVAGLSIELVDHVSNKTLCEVHATPDNDGGITYGRGNTPGDENGYLVGLNTCKWGAATAPRFRRDHPMRTRAVYNATTGHTGVMSLWLMEVSAVQSEPDFLV